MIKMIKNLNDYNINIKLQTKQNQDKNSKIK